MKCPFQLKMITWFAGDVGMTGDLWRCISVFIGREFNNNETERERENVLPLRSRFVAVRAEVTKHSAIGSIIKEPFQ